MKRLLTQVILIASGKHIFSEVLQVFIDFIPLYGPVNIFYSGAEQRGAGYAG